MPLEHEINKNETNLLLKQYKIIKRVKYLENDKIIYVKYYLGEKIMNNKKMTIEDLALEMRAGFKSVNERLDKVESRLDKLEKDVCELKIKVNNIDEDVSDIKTRLDKIEKCPTIQEELNYINGYNNNEPTMREMIKQLVKDMSDIKKCPTIKKELEMI